MKSVLFLLCVMALRSSMVAGDDEKENKDTDTKDTNPESEGKVKRWTGDVCHGQPLKCDPKSGHKFEPKCASCISRASVTGGSCWENTWTFQTLCSCEDDTFMECECYRRMNIVGMFCFFILPGVVLFLTVVALICKNFKFCPLAKMEAELASANKGKAKGSKKEHKKKKDGKKDKKDDKKSKKKKGKK